MRIFDPLHHEPDQPGPGHEFPATAGKRLVDWAEFIATEPHGIPPGGGWLKWLGLAGTQGRKSLNDRPAATIPARGKPMVNLAKAVPQLQKERNHARRRA